MWSNQPLSNYSVHLYIFLIVFELSSVSFIDYYSASFPYFAIS